MLDEAVAIERANTGFIFLGSFVQRATVHVHAGEHDGAWPLVDLALRRYAESDHVYADSMNAAAHFIAGCLHERAGAADKASASYAAGVALAESRDHRLGIGAQWVKCRCGAARMLARSGARLEANAMVDSTREVLRSRSRFVRDGS